MSSAASSKPKVLLSIVEYEDFDHVDDIETLSTDVSIGHGYYECERLLKKGFIELMNLPPLPILGLYVCQRDQSGKKQARYLAIVPLGAIHPAFLDGGCVTSASNEPATWKKWLGLFGAKVPLKDQSPEEIFQKCLMMGASDGHHPKLLVQLQFADVGSATSPLTPPTAVAANKETARFVDIISRLYNLRGMSPPRNLYRASIEELVHLFEVVVGLMEAAAASHTSSVGLPSSSPSLIVDGGASVPGVAWGLMEAAAASKTPSVCLPSSSSALVGDGEASLPGVAWGLMRAAASQTSSVGLPSSSAALLVDGAASLPGVAPRGQCVSQPSYASALGSGCSTPRVLHPSSASYANSTQTSNSEKGLSTDLVAESGLQPLDTSRQQYDISLKTSPVFIDMESSISSTVSTQCGSVLSGGSHPSCASPANSAQPVKPLCASLSNMDMESSSFSLWHQQAKALLDSLGPAREPEIEDDIADFLMPET